MKRVGKDKRIRIGPIGEAVLVSVAVVGFVSVAVLFPGVTTLIAPFVRKKKYSPRQSIQRNVMSLIRQGLLKKTVSKNGTVHLELTRKGRWEAFLRAPKESREKRKGWDKQWRIIIFDVPQAKTKVRDELRRGVQMYGFKQLQQSVWVYPYACDNFVKILKEHLGVASDVLYMKVSYIENERHLRREFNLT
jgi:DNA-binding transcriptional regulator PaaX